MANTCEGLDASLPRELREEIRKHVDRKYPKGHPKRPEHLDGEDSCVFHYLLDEPGKCDGDACCLSAAGKKVQKEKDGVTPYRPKQRLEDPLPPGATGTRGARGGKVVARRKARRTAKPRRPGR